MTEKTIILPPIPEGNGEAKYRLTVMIPKRRYLSYLRERWWVVMVCLVLGIGAMVAFETLRAERFESYATLYFSQDAPLVQASMFSGESPTYFGTQIQLLKSPHLQNEALEQLGPAAQDNLKSSPGQPLFSVDVARPMGTSVLQLHAVGGDPALTQQFLEALITDFLNYKKEARKTTSDDLTTSLTDQLLEQEKELQSAQDQWAEFQKTNNVSAIEDEGKSVGAYLAELNLEISKLSLERDLLHQDIETETTVLSNALPATGATNLEIRPVLPPVAAVSPIAAPAPTTNQVVTADDTTLKSARVELAALIGDRENKIRSMGEHAYQQQLESQQRLVYILEREYISQQQVQLQELDRRISGIRTIIPTLEQKMLDINQRFSQTQRLKSDIDRAQQYRDHLLATLQSVDLNKSVQPEQISVLEPASPGHPELRHLPVRIFLAVVGSVAVALGLVFVWYLLDDRFVSVGDIKDQFGETILGLVPQVKISRTKPLAALLENSDPRLGYVESFRHLRSALLLSSFGEGRPQTLLFTSALSAEGKTTIAVNLARLLARSGLRVVLVDADVRGGGLKQILNGSAQLGVFDYLRGEAGAEAVVHPTECEGLSMVPLGTRTDHFEGLFLRPQLGDLIVELRQKADFVILDGAPILASDATALLVPHADTVILVTRPFYTHSCRVRQSLDMLYQRRARHVSIILNRARAEDLAGQYAIKSVSSANGNGKV